MSMDSPQMKPADQTIYLLGELSGKVGSLQQSVENATTSQSQINSGNETEHAEFRRSIGDLATTVAVIASQQKKPTPWWSVASGVAGIAAVAAVVIQWINT